MVTCHLNTGTFKSYSKHDTQTIRQLPQYKFGQLLRRLEVQVIKVQERSEADTSQLGDLISPIIGYDSHKCAAMMFALKVICYELFQQLTTFLFGAPSDEGNGSRRRKQRRESALTVPPVSNFSNKHEVLDGDDVPRRGHRLPPDSKWRESLSLLDNLKAPFPCLHISYIKNYKDMVRYRDLVVKHPH